MKGRDTFVQHHAKNTFQDEYRYFLKKYKVEYDEKYGAVGITINVLSVTLPYYAPFALVKTGLLLKFKRK